MKKFKILAAAVPVLVLLAILAFAASAWADGYEPSQGGAAASGGAGWTFSVVTDDTSASDGDFIAVNGGTSKDVLLPAAAEGARVRVVHVSGNGCTITTQSGDTIQLNGTTTAADPGVLTASSTNGESIELWAEDATNWVAVGGSGVWDNGE